MESVNILNESVIREHEAINPEHADRWAACMVVTWLDKQLPAISLLIACNTMGDE